MGNSLPNQSYKVFKSRPLTTEGKDALIYLYQPIIESDALALYLTLASDVQAQSFSGEESMMTVHLDILNAMNAGMPRFIKAKQNLEGIGLLKSLSPYTHLRAHETGRNLVCRLLLEKKNGMV